MKHITDGAIALFLMAGSAVVAAFLLTALLTVAPIITVSVIVGLALCEWSTRPLP